MFHDSIAYSRDILNALFDGLGLKEFLGGEEKCFTTLEDFLWYLYYAYNGLYAGSELYDGFLNIAKAIGQISPVLRNCYKFSEENEKQWVLLADRLFVFENLFFAFKNNIVKFYGRIDKLSWSFFLKLRQENYVDATKKLS